MKCHCAWCLAAQLFSFSCSHLACNSKDWGFLFLFQGVCLSIFNSVIEINRNYATALCLRSLCAHFPIHQRKFLKSRWTVSTDFDREKKKIPFRFPSRPAPHTPSKLCERGGLFRETQKMSGLEEQTWSITCSRANGHQLLGSGDLGLFREGFCR